MNTTTKPRLNKALEEYNRVKEELNRPQEDLVMIAACELVKKSISDFLKAYLDDNRVSFSEDTDLLTLQQECVKLNKSFSDLKLESIAVLSEDYSLSYTNNLEDARLTNYDHTLDQAKELVLSLM